MKKLLLIVAATFSLSLSQAQAVSDNPIFVLFSVIKSDCKYFTHFKKLAHGVESNDATKLKTALENFKQLTGSGEEAKAEARKYIGYFKEAYSLKKNYAALLKSDKKGDIRGVKVVYEFLKSFNIFVAHQGLLSKIKQLDFQKEMSANLKGDLARAFCRTKTQTLQDIFEIIVEIHDGNSEKYKDIKDEAAFKAVQASLDKLFDIEKIQEKAECLCGLYYSSDDDSASDEENPE